MYIYGRNIITKANNMQHHVYEQTASGEVLYRGSIAKIGRHWYSTHFDGEYRQTSKKKAIEMLLWAQNLAFGDTNE